MFSHFPTTLFPLSTMMVIRDRDGSSVTPTARESMLKARREKRLATRFKTPARFSTRTDMVCFIVRSSLFNPWSSTRG